MSKKLSRAFYLNPDVTEISKALLGKFLCTNKSGEGLTSGMIVETEAYGGVIDKASHAFGERRTNRTKVMYEEGGIAYIYLIYGMYNLFNIITNQAGIPHAILIRAIEPVDGIDVMLKRRNLPKVERRLTAGPGLLTIALNIDRTDNGKDLRGNEVWIEDRGVIVADENIIESKRVNIDYAGDDAFLDWRYRIKGNSWTSKPHH